MTLAEISGIDLTVGLELVHGRPDRYAALLGLFANQYGATGAQLRAAVAAGDYDEAGRIAHTIKGSSATLGAVVVAAAARAVETELKRCRGAGGGDRQLDRVVEELAGALDTLTTSIERLGQVGAAS